MRGRSPTRRHGDERSNSHSRRSAVPRSRSAATPRHLGLSGFEAHLQATELKHLGVPLRNLSREQRQLASHFIRSINQTMDPGRSTAARVQRRAAERLGAIDPTVQAEIARISRGLAEAVALPTDGAGDVPQRRRLAAVDFLGKVFRNDFEGNFGRNAANVFNICLRTGLVVTIATFTRDAISFEINRAKALGNAQSAIEALGIACIALAPLLNVIGGLRDGLLGTSTQASSLSRTLLSTTHTVLVTTCHFLGNFPAVRDSAITMTSYSMLRDLLNFVAPLKDNLSSLPWLALGISTLIYASMQVIVGTAIDVAAPRAGAGGLPPIGPEGVASALATATLVIGDTLLKAGLNASIEVSDDLAVLYIARAIEVRRYRTKTAGVRAQESAYVYREARLLEFGRHLLDANRAARADMIARENRLLYLLEEERLNGLELHSGGEADRMSQGIRQALIDEEAREQAHSETLANFSKRDQAAFDRSFSPRRSTLPLMEVLRRGADAVVPDFEYLDTQIRHSLKKSMPDASQEERDELMRELYIDAVVRTMMPVPESALQKKLRDEVRRHGSLSPLAVRVKVNRMVQDQRAARMAPLRVSLGGVWKMQGDSLGRAAAGQLLTTNSARVNAFQALLALLVLMAPVVDQLEDGALKSFLTSALVGTAMVLLYPALYKSHDARAPRQRLELPGGTGAPEAPPEELEEETNPTHAPPDTMAEAEGSGDASDRARRDRDPVIPRPGAAVRFDFNLPRGSASVPRRRRRSSDKENNRSQDAALSGRSGRAERHAVDSPRPSSRSGGSAASSASTGFAGPAQPDAGLGRSRRSDSEDESGSGTASGTTRRQEPESIRSPGSKSSSSRTPSSSPLMTRRRQQELVVGLPSRSEAPPGPSSSSSTS